MGARVYLLVGEQRRRMIADPNNQLIFVFMNSMFVLY